MQQFARKLRNLTVLSPKCQTQSVLSPYFAGIRLFHLRYAYRAVTCSCFQKNCETKLFHLLTVKAIVLYLQNCSLKSCRFFPKQASYCSISSFLPIVCRYSIFFLKNLQIL